MIVIFGTTDWLKVLGTGRKRSVTRRVVVVAYMCWVILSSPNRSPRKDSPEGDFTSHIPANMTTQLLTTVYLNVTVCSTTAEATES